MQIKNPTAEQLNNWSSNLKNYVQTNFELVEEKFVVLGSKVVRILNYSKDFTSLIEKQLTYSLKNQSSNYDATLVLWNEKDVENIAKKIGKEFDLKFNMKLRIELLYSKTKQLFFSVIDEEVSNSNPIIDINPSRGFINFYDKTSNTHYYGVKNLEPEEFIKEGHIFIQIFNKIAKTDTINLVHGAVVGANNNGILFCARGQRGKSTLAVLSMMEGFEYVSDDYLVLERENDKLYSYPIYSIITLSPRMYNELYDRLDGCCFVSNNARKDKYVINIAKFHPQFKSKYPINVCIFPEIVSDKDPSIRLCNEEEKGRAIVQLIQSTVAQMQDINNNKVILKLLNMVKDFEFYKLNLCNNIEENTRFLKNFIKDYIPKKSDVETDRMLIDITFDIANILDSKTGTISTMNKFATNIYENLAHGVSPDLIAKTLDEKISPEFGFKNQVDMLVNFLSEYGILPQQSANLNPDINFEFAAENNYKLSVLKFETNETIEIIKEESKDELCVK